MHGLRRGIFRLKSRLRKHAEVLLAMDRAILREGGVHNLPTDALRKACLIRGAKHLILFTYLRAVIYTYSFYRTKSFKYEQRRSYCLAYEMDNHFKRNRRQKPLFVVTLPSTVGV